MSVFDIFKKLDEQKAAQAAGPVEWLVVGLGNPGSKYDNTRHNAGFRALEGWCARSGQRIDRMKFKALVGEAALGGSRVLLMKPQTFMNLSGDAVRKAADFYKVPPERIIVLFDDISLAPGRLRIRKTGSAGGHNGIKSIIGNIGQDFPRVKIGVGEKPRPEYDLADWVLSRLTQAEKKAVEARYDDICGALELMMKGQFDTAMSRYNG